MSKCETCRYCTELGRNAGGEAVIRRCINKNNKKYEDKVTDDCPDYQYTDDPFCTEHSRCVTCRYAKEIIRNDINCPVKCICCKTGEAVEDFVVYDCPDYMADGRKLIPDNGTVSFGGRDTKTAKEQSPAEQAKKEEKAYLKYLFIGLALVVVLVIVLILVISGGKKHPSDEEIPVDGYTVGDDFTLPEYTTEAPSFVTADMNEPAFVTPEVGLRLRRTPSTDGDEIDVMPYQAAVTVLTYRDDWAYVDYNGTQGWCSRDYLELGTIPTYGADDVTAAINNANSIIASYCGKVLPNGKATLDTAYVITYFQEAEKIYKQFLWRPGTLFDETHEDLKCLGGNYGGKYFRVTDDKYTTVESLCEYLFSYFSDDVARNMLTNKVFVINGNMYIYYGSPDSKDLKVVTEPAVTQDAIDTYTLALTVKVYDDPIDVNMLTNQYVITYPCSLLNGRWVFTHMEVIPE